MNRHEKVIEALLEVARPLVLEQFRPDSCIASTRLAHLVLDDYYGIASHPTEVEVTVHNQLSKDAMELGLEPNWTEGAWSLGVRRTPPEGISKAGGWRGAHLVLLVDDILVDLSADQFARPDKDIQAHALAFRIDDSFFNEETLWGISVENPYTLFVYRYLDPQDLSYRQAPDWDRKRYRQLSGQVIRAMEAWLNRDAQEAPDGQPGTSDGHP